MKRGVIILHRPSTAGKCVGSEASVNGEIHVPNLSEEHSLDNVDVSGPHC